MVGYSNSKPNRSLSYLTRSKSAVGERGFLRTSRELRIFDQWSVLSLHVFQGAELALLSAAFVLSQAVFSGSPGINTAASCVCLLTFDL